MATERRAARVMIEAANFIVRMRKLLGVIRECRMRDGLVMRMINSSWSFYILREPVQRGLIRPQQARQLAGERKACGRAASQ